MSPIPEVAIRMSEFVEYGQAIKAPERDTDATAFELDHSCLAPQVRKKITVGGDSDLIICTASTWHSA